MLEPYVIDVFIEDKGICNPLRLRVSRPNKTDGEADYYCLVDAPALFKGDKKIFGASEEQARELALQFVKQLLDDRKLIDKNGQYVQL